MNNKLIILTIIEFIHLIIKVMRFKRLLLLVCITTLLSACGEESKVDSTEKVEPSDFVYLESVKPPKFGERFITVIAERSFTVSWGLGDNYVWSQSGYPGFGYPVVIEVENEFREESLILTVSWGEYNYQLVNVFECTVSEDGSLINYDNGKSVVDFNRMSDRLFVMCRETKLCAEYKLVSGTEIKVRDES